MKLLFFVIFLLPVLFLNARSVVFLSEIAYPRMIAVDDNHLYVSDQYSVFVYSLKNYKLINRLGQKGQGPGEFQTKPFIQVLENELLLSSLLQICYYSKTGEFIQEKRNIGPFSHVFKMGKNFVVQKLHWDKEGLTISYWIYNDQFQAQKLLYQTPRIPHGGFNNPVELVLPRAKLICYKDRIYILTKKEDFCIELYDAQGKQISIIKRDYQRIKITEQHKQKLKEAFWSIPVVRKRISHHKKRKYIFPEYFPAINDLYISDNTLYVKTFFTKNGKEEYILLDLNGKYLKEVYLPEAARHYYAFKNNQFYFITENIDEEDWEFRMVPVE